MINNIERSIGWPKRIQKLDLSLLEHQFGQAFIQSHILRISATNSAALEVDWKIVNSSTAKHQGYAVQWFLMAAVLLIALIFANSNLAEVSGFKKNH
jgi:cytochrome oxidase assembly protein ShyY1